MNWVGENAVVIWVGGAVFVTLAFVVYSQLRTTTALLAILAVVLVTAALLVAEYLIVTPREAVAQTLNDLAAAIEADDLPAVLRFIAPDSKTVRGDAESLMPLVTVEKARIVSTPQIDVDESTQPATATARCQGLVDVTIKQNGMKGPYLDRVEIHFIRDGDRWLIKSYKPEKDWQRAASGKRNQ
jgi:hypothetical protein